MSLTKILLVEDEADILDALEYSLTREGYRVLSTRNGEDGIRLAREHAPHVILLDVMLPGRDGVEVCRALKTDSVTRDIPVIMVTAKDEEADVVLGLGVGADDYVTKPFGTKELIARVRAVLRRSGPSTDPAAERVVLSHVVIDVARHEVLVDGARVVLTPTELRLLHFLASRPGRVFSRDQLLSRVVGGGAHVIDRNVDVHIRAIRRKLGDYRDAVETVRGVGYRFNADAA